MTNFFGVMWQKLGNLGETANKIKCESEILKLAMYVI